MTSQESRVPRALIRQAHAFLDDYVERQGYFRAALGRLAQDLPEAPLFVLAVWPIHGENEVRVSFSLHEAFNALYPRPEVRAIAEECLAAVRDAFPGLGAHHLTFDFHRGGEPPPRK